MISIIKKRFEENILVKQSLLADAKLLALVARIAQAVTDALHKGNKLIFAGNGGSFADSIHLAAEIVSRFQRQRAPLAAIALGANNSIMTAVANDYGYENVFAREIEAVGQAGDVFIALSTSGNSKNIINAVETAKRIGVTTYCLTGGSGGQLNSMAECVRVPSDVTARIQEVHILIGHIICELVEDKFIAR